MNKFSSFRDYVDSVRGRTVAANSVTSFSSTIMNKAAAAAIPKEGITSVFPGHHLYAMLLLRPKFTTSSLNEDRKKHIKLIARLAQGVRMIVHHYDGALLEVQGPVVHAFIPNEDGSRENAIAASFAIQEFINAQIRADAGNDFIKSLVSFCHGPTIFVASEDTHGDNSIVSLAPAANAPAKVLWRENDSLTDGSVIEVETDGETKIIERTSYPSTSLQKSANEMIANSSRGLPRLTMLEAKAMSVPYRDSPDSPTVEEPLNSYSISFRADMDGFTHQVTQAFENGEEAVDALALHFLEIMRHARGFCTKQECIHLPWAGDCFNLLISFSEREEYQLARDRKILEIAKQFYEHMKTKFPNVKWAFSHAAGDLENAQVCNTLVSRITVGHTTILLATGLPVERSLSGLIKESPLAGYGVIWKEDVAELDDDLGEILKPCPGGKNHRHFSLIELSRAMDKHDFQPTPKAYISAPTKTAAIATAPLVRPYAL